MKNYKNTEEPLLYTSQEIDIYDMKLHEEAKIGEYNSVADYTTNVMRGCREDGFIALMIKVMGSWPRLLCHLMLNCPLKFPSLHLNQVVVRILQGLAKNEKTYLSRKIRNLCSLNSINCSLFFYRYDDRSLC